MKITHKLNTLDSIIKTLEEAIEMQDIERAKVMVIASKHAIQAHALKYAMNHRISIAHENNKRVQELSHV
jgi:hypothetical protein